MSVEKVVTEEQVVQARLAKAMGHPIRVAILQMLANHTCYYHSDMLEVFPVAKSTLSQHLKELKEVGLIHGTVALPMVKYCINKDRWEQAQKMFSDFFTNIIFGG